METKKYRIFDPNPETLPIEIKNTYNIYYYVFNFINRVRIKTSSINVILLDNNFDFYLFGTTNN